MRTTSTLPTRHAGGSVANVDVAPRRAQPGRSVTSKVLAILAAFDVEHPALSLTEISRRTGMPLATVHRLVGELEAWRAVDRDEDGLYHVGLRLWEVGLRSPLATQMRELALPIMADLYESTRENIHLAVRDGADALYVEKLTGHRAVPVISRIGGRLPLHSTGVGKALLAWAPPAFVANYCRGPLARPTRFTITEPGRLARELALVRRRGFAVTREEMTLGSCSVAVPVLSAEDGTAVASLGVVVHSVRSDLPRLAPRLQAAARLLADRLAAPSCTDHARSAGPAPSCTDHAQTIAGRARRAVV